MPKLIIFDIGGVLISYGEEKYAAYISKKYGIQYKKFIGVLNRYLPVLELGNERTSSVLKRLARQLGLTESELEWGKAFRLLAKPNSDVINLANRLARKYKLVLLTNMSFSRYKEARALLKGVRYRRIFASCYMHMRKPSKQIYLHLLKEMHAKPSEALFVDNLAENVAGASRVGIRALRFVTYKTLVKDLKKLGVVA
ncbi:MAG: HAD-IA family hydrolase [Candidatus Micrarchaeia archaeon]